MAFSHWGLSKSYCILLYLLCVGIVRLLYKIYSFCLFVVTVMNAEEIPRTVIAYHSTKKVSVLQSVTDSAYIGEAVIQLILIEGNRHQVQFISCWSSKLVAGRFWPEPRTDFWSVVALGSWWCRRLLFIKWLGWDDYNDRKFDKQHIFASDLWLCWIRKCRFHKTDFENNRLCPATAQVGFLRPRGILYVE